MKRKNKIAEINCDEAAKLFNDFIDNYLKGASKEELIHHVEGCRHCFERIEFETMLKSKLRSLSEADSAEEQVPGKSAREVLSKIFNHE